MKTANVSLRVHPDVKAALSALVAEEHLEESAYVRRLLIQHLKAKGKLPASWTGR